MPRDARGLGRHDEPSSIRARGPGRYHNEQLRDARALELGANPCEEHGLRCHPPKRARPHTAPLP
eukprot:1694306-Pleurochrysis_carterae.AAC.1